MKTFIVKYTARGVGLTVYSSFIEVNADSAEQADPAARKKLQSPGLAITITDIREVDHEQLRRRLQS